LPKHLIRGPYSFLYGRKRQPPLQSLTNTDGRARISIYQGKMPFTSIQRLRKLGLTAAPTSGGGQCPGFVTKTSLEKLGGHPPRSRWCPTSPPARHRPRGTNGGISSPLGFLANNCWLFAVQRWPFYSAGVAPITPGSQLPRLNVPRSRLWYGAFCHHEPTGGGCGLRSHDHGAPVEWRPYALPPFF